jgi:hypothetical protein
MLAHFTPFRHSTELLAEAGLPAFDPDQNRFAFASGIAAGARRIK